MKTTCTWRLPIVVWLALGNATACSGQTSDTPPANQQATQPATRPAPPTAADAPLPDTASPYDALPESARALMDKPFTGDLDALIARRMIRVAVTFNRTHYFIDEGQQRGLAYESLRNFEDDLNAQAKTSNLKVHVVFVPLPRDQLDAALANGKVDIVAAMVTVTPERQALVAFSGRRAPM